jgi:ATP-binding cassette subfamily F protein uup
MRESVREKNMSLAQAQPKAAKRKLSFHEKLALETLPGEMAKLQATVRDLQAKLADPDLYARDRDAFGRATDALAQAQADLATAEERWLELEILREEMESS